MLSIAERHKYILEKLEKYGFIRITDVAEELGVKDQNKLSWMSQYAQNHEVFEGLQTVTPDPAAGIYATPLNTLGMGNPMAPGAGSAAVPMGGSGDFFRQAVGVGEAAGIAQQSHILEPDAHQAVEPVGGLTDGMGVKQDMFVVQHGISPFRTVSFFSILHDFACFVKRKNTIFCVLYIIQL